MNLCKTMAALEALKEFKASKDRNKALAMYDSVISQTAQSVLVKDGCISEDILEVMFVRMETEAERFHSALSVDQQHSHLLRECDVLLSQMSFWFRLMRSLNGGCLPFDELYELEAAAQALVN